MIHLIIPFFHHLIQIFKQTIINIETNAPEEYLQQVEARITFAIGEEPQNIPFKNRSWHNRRMVYIKCSLIGTALDWYTNLHISYKQQWNSFVQLFKKQFLSQKTA